MTKKKSNHGGFREENLKSFKLENISVEGVRVFANTFGYSLAFIKAVQATPAGATAFVGNRIFVLKFVKAANDYLSGGKKRQTKDEAMTAKLEAETRKLERDEKIENEEMFYRDVLEEILWQKCLSILRGRTINQKRQILMQIHQAKTIEDREKILDDYAAATLREIELNAPKEI